MAKMRYKSKQKFIQNGLVSYCNSYDNLNVDINRSLIIEAEHIHSPNYDLRPPDTEIDMLVIHGISLPPGEFSPKSESYIKDLFTNRLDISIHPFFRTIADIKVSSHCLITRTGKLLQFVPFRYRAWHAGISYFEGKDNCNDFSIGIELEGTDDTPYTNIQYMVLQKLIKAIRTLYPKIIPDRVVGHNQISPDRKTDPGKYFNWHLIK